MWRTKLLFLFKYFYFFLLSFTLSSSEQNGWSFSFSLFSNVNVNRVEVFLFLFKTNIEQKKSGCKKKDGKSEFLINFYRFRYYRANSVRYSTQPCEAACALNHYCAITRIDYNEFKQCLKSAASALASSSGKPSCFAFSSTHLTLTLAIYSVLNYQQKKIFIEWLHFILVECLIIRYFKEILSAIPNLLRTTYRRLVRFTLAKWWPRGSVATSKLVGPTAALSNDFCFTYCWIRKMNNFKICLIARRIFMQRFLKTLLNYFIKISVQLKTKINQNIENQLNYLFNSIELIVSCQNYIDFIKLASFKENQINNNYRMFKSKRLNRAVVNICDDRFLKQLPFDENSVK